MAARPPVYVNSPGRDTPPGPPPGFRDGITLGPYHQTFAPPPAAVLPPSRMVPGGIPGQPIYFQLPPPSPNDPYPGFISPADARMEALKEAALYSQPALNELRRQQKLVHDRNVAEQAGIMAITKLLTGFGGPESQIQGFEGQQRYLAALQQGNADENDVMAKIQDLLSGEPGVAQKALADLQKEQSGLASDYASAHKPVIRSLQGGLWGYDPSNPTKGGWIVPPPGQAGKPPKTVSGPDGLYAWNQEKNGDWSLVPIGPRKSAAAKPPKTISGPDGLYSWQQTKDGWQLVPVGPRKSATASGTHYQHVEVAGKQYVFDPASGTFYDPATGQPVVPKNSPQKGVTASTIAKGWKVINAWKGPVWTRQGDDQPLTTSQIRGIIGDWNSHAKEFNKTAKKEDRIPTLTLADLPNLTPEQAGELGLSQTRLRPDEIYLKLVREVGVPARRAWQMVRRVYPQWGKGYFSPKADAAQVAALTPFNGQPLVAIHGTQTPQRIIIHDTESSGSPQSVVDGWRGTNLGAQFVIGPNGEVLQTASPTSITYHAGGMNNGSVGIEIVGFAKWSRADWLKHPRQLDAVARTIAQIALTYHIPITFGPDGVWTHAEVSKGHGASEGHWDPGPGFPMQDVLRRANQYLGTFSQQPADGSRTLASASGPTGNVKNYAFQTAGKKYGWKGSELSALDQLWEHESGWDYTVHNKSSGAAGIPQALGHKLPPGYDDDPQVQIQWGLRYIKTTYGTPSRAWAFWQATVHKNANLAPPDLRAKAIYWIRRGYAGY